MTRPRLNRATAIRCGRNRSSDSRGCVLLRLALLAGLLVAGAGPASGESWFRRGDSNDDGQLDISDAVCTLQYLFGGGGQQCSSGDCLDARDTNDNGRLDLTDAIFLLNYLFLGGDEPAAPFAACGPDPTPEDPLGCLSTKSCASSGEITLEVAPGAKLFSMWSEGYDTVIDQHAVLSIIEFREGIYHLSASGDTPEVDLIESVRFGPGLETAPPLDTGTFLFDPGGMRQYEYVQSFQTVAGELTFHLLYEPSDGKLDLLDCEFLEGHATLPWPVLFALLRVGEAEQFVHYSCFHPPAWRVPGHASPRVLTLDDGSSLRLELEESWDLYRGVSGETANRRLSRAVVDFRGQGLEVTEYPRLIHAGRHHNWKQEFRVLFDVPVDGVHGIDVVDCPSISSPECSPAGVARAYLLDETLRRTAEIGIAAYQIGS